MEQFPSGLSWRNCDKILKLSIGECAVNLYYDTPSLPMQCVECVAAQWIAKLRVQKPEIAPSYLP